MPSVVAISFLILGSVIFSFTLVIVCGKRKLYQRKLCSRRDPHIPGEEAKKTLKREIERRICRVPDIVYEPHLLQFADENDKNFPSYYFRMKAVDNMKYLEEEIKCIDGSPRRGGRESIRSFLVNLSSSGGILSDVEPRIIHELCDQYNHARHHPSPFTAENFSSFQALLTKILHSARRSRHSERHTSLCGGNIASSDHDSAIDEPDQIGDDDNLLVSEVNLVLVHRPTELRTNDEDSYETPV
ncbi:UNVERIFIED_CONTAM: hypothetical protein RMT77_003764 [Armadillidium vulgare]